MSADALTEILKILRKHQNLSVKVSLSRDNKGSHLTKISLKESTGSQEPLISDKIKKKNKKSPSRLLRDGARHAAYLAKLAGSSGTDPAAASPATTTVPLTDVTGTLRIATPGRRLIAGGAGMEQEGEVWQPGAVDEVEETLIPQLDGEGKDLCEEYDEDFREKEDLREEKDKEERIKEDEKGKEESGDVFCIHEVRIDTTKFRPECRKCRNNHYKLLNKICSHYEQTKNCYQCENVNGWMYKSI